MKAMILAAGLGKRMRPLTDHTPKPLLKVGGKPLLQYHLEALSAKGITEVVINLAYLGEQIQAFVGNGRAFDLKVRYSKEPEPLETGGAIVQALPLLGDEPFLLINGDVWCENSALDFADSPLTASCDGKLLLVPNPDFNPEGDFGLTDTGDLTLESPAPRYTFAGISLLHPRLIKDYPNKRRKFALLEVFKSSIAQGRLKGELYRGTWSDVGTPERLRVLDEALARR